MADLEDDGIVWEKPLTQQAAPQQAPEDDIVWEKPMQADDGIVWEKPIEEPVGESPGILKSAAQGVLDMGGQVARAGTFLAGGGIENVGELFDSEGMKQAGQSLQDTGKGWQKSIGETILTPEERRGQDVVDKVAGGVAGFLPLLTLGPVAGTVLGAGTAGVGTAADALDAGETMASATTAGAIQGASVLAMLRLPGFAKTIPGTLGVVAATGPVAGAAADYLTAEVMDTDEGKSPYVMYDKNGKINKDYFANRITETLTGGVFGAYGRYKWQNLPETKLAQDIAKLNGAEADAYYAKLTDRVDKILETNSWTSYHQPNETWERTRERFFKDTDSFHDWWVNKDLMETERAKNIPQALEIFFHTAPDAETKAYAAYLLERSSIEGLNWANVMTLTKGHPDSPKGGSYALGADMVRMEGGLRETLMPDPTTGQMQLKPDWDAFTKVALHEIGHARTMARVAELANRDPALNDQFNEVFRTMRERVAEKFITQDIDADPNTRWRGLKNAEEFFAELPLASNYFTAGAGVHNYRGTLERSLKSDLASIELTPSEIASLFPKETKKTKKTGYLPANTKRFYEMMGANKQPKTMLDVATAWYEVLMRDMDLTRAQRYKLWTNSSNMSYELKRPVSEAIGRKMAAQKAIKDDMAVKGTEDRRFWQVLWTNLRNSDSAQEFGIRMANIDPANKRLAAWAEANAQKIFDKKDWYAEILKDEAGIVPMGPSSNRALDSRDVAQFIEDEKPQGGPDIKLNSLQRAFLNPLTIRLMVGQQGFAGRAVKYMIDMGLRYSHEADKIYHQFKTEDAKEYYKLSKKEQANVMNMAAHFDSFQGRQMLQRANVHWPDEAMMRTAFPKITDAEIAGYKGLARGVDNLFHVLDMLSRKTTGQGIPRIPGFMPHYHAGPYKVFLSKPMAGRNGQSIDKTVLVRGFSTRKQAQIFADHMKKHSGLSVVPDPRTGGDIRVFQWDDVGQSMLGNYKDHVDAFLNMQEVFRNSEREAEMKTIQKAEDTVNAEWSKHMQERSGVKGYIGEFGMSANPWDSKWTNFKLKHFGESETLRIYDKYAREVAETYRNIMFLEDVYAPLMGLDTSPMGKERHGQALMKYENAFKYMEKFGKNFLGKNLNHLSWVDNSIRTGLIKMGWDPMLVKNFVRTTRNMLGATKLRVNPANWIANYIQKVHTIAQLQYMEVVSGGDPSGAVQSFIRVARKTPEELGAAYVRAKEWAANQHIVDPLLDMEVKGESKGLFANTPLLGGIQHAWNKTGEVNAIIERHGRTQSFLTAFDFYLRKGMDEGAAREAARLVMGMTMVNYDRASRPLMYQDLGMIGEAMAPFAVFRNAFLGNMYMMTKTLVTSQNKMTAAKPLMTTMLTFMALAGAAGIPLMGEYDMLINFINYMYPGQMDLPTGEVLMMKADVPDILMYGVPSQMFKLLGFSNGINFSPSMGAVNVDDAGSFAILPYWKAMGQVLKLGVQIPLSATGAVEPPSVTDFYDPAKKLTPNVLHPMIEAFISGGDFSRGLKSTSAEGLTKRDPADIISLIVSGKHSIKERKERAIEGEIDRKEEELKGNLRHLIKLRADFLEGIPVMMDVEDIDRRAMEIYKTTGQDPSGYNKRVFQEVMKRKLDKQTKRHLSSSPSKYWKERMRQQLLGNGPSVDVPTPEMEEE